LRHFETFRTNQKQQARTKTELYELCEHLLLGEFLEKLHHRRAQDKFRPDFRTRPLQESAPGNRPAFSGKYRSDLVEDRVFRPPQTHDQKPGLLAKFSFLISNLPNVILRQFLLLHRSPRPPSLQKPHQAAVDHLGLLD
jgi:hypothetical protein